MPAGLRPSPPDHFSAYKERHANSAPKIRLATMASHKARDGLSPRAMLMWLVIMTPGGQRQPEPVPEHPLLPLRAK